MKKSILLVFIILCFSNIISAQTETSFGVKGGLNLTFFNVSEANFGENTETATGFYTGVFVDFDLGDKLHLQPELLYIGLNDFKFLNAPIYFKYQATNKLDLLVGPSMNYFFDFFTNKFKVRADIGLAYTISNALDAHVKYTIGFEEITPNGLFLGLGYRL